MSSVYVVMSKGKWSKQPSLEIQHGLIPKEEMAKESSMEKAIKEAVENAMSKWQAKEQGGKQQGRDNWIGSRSNSDALLLGTTLTPELLAVLLQGATVQITQAAVGEG